MEMKYNISYVYTDKETGEELPGTGVVESSTAVKTAKQRKELARQIEQENKDMLKVRIVKCIREPGDRNWGGLHGGED
jgi:hypothetical protein